MEISPNLRDFVIPQENEATEMNYLKITQH